ncbi:sensor histidine kinase [Streptomyces meridianus]|uniref:GAF domain-containing protein n=1 Tax=Streptomyces meridianus TaxID=2938945 RepID=A0ABT0X4Z3_9ACTN|nr:GAF domain-containing protein [Streptomyces meridianus]MCM2577410.1 GAF domain-containing protein [Streptomyces meridianus]
MEGVAGSGSLPRLRLDDLLEELQARIDEVRGTRDRVHGLLEAVVSVGQELDLPEVLQRIVEAAVVLVDAGYGALGVIGEDHRTLAQFIPVGMSEEQVEAIGPLPAGHGILGELIRHPEPLRLAELSEHAASYGIPENHPPMHSFLGVPIRVRDEVFGNLYLTEKRTAKEFDAEDEAVVSTLAVAAGVAIENARMYEEARRRERWLKASTEVTSSLLSGAPQSQVLELIVNSARHISSAALAVVALPVEGAQELQVARAVGFAAERHLSLVTPCEGSFMGAAFITGETVTTTDIEHDPRITVGPRRWAGLGPAVAVPMGTGEGVRGVLLLARPQGEPVFTESETGPLLGFADQAAVALELAERRRDAEQLVLLADRDRIARDLHDLAIQRLFATGMTLQSMQRFVAHPEATERLQRAVDDLDATIKIIRSTIFGLRTHEGGPTEPGLRVRVAESIEEAVPQLGFTPALRMEGLVDTDVPRDMADHVVAVLGEALTNIARHARASAAEISLAVAGHGLRLTVVDNGRGIAVGTPRGGLRNISERAQALGGDVRLEEPSGGGTRLVWAVPLPGD